MREDERLTGEYISWEECDGSNDANRNCVDPMHAWLYYWFCEKDI